MYGLNKDGATEDGYPINKNQHHAQANIYEKNDANGRVRYGRTFARHT